MVKAFGAGLLCAVVVFGIVGPAAQADVTDLRVREEESAFLGLGLGDHYGDGARVARVQEGSAAEVAGLEPGDVILSFDDETIRGNGSLIHAVRARRPGERVSLVVLRDGNEEALDVRLGSRRQWKLDLDREYYIVGPSVRGRVRGSIALDGEEELEQVFLCDGDACRFSYDEPMWYRLDCVEDGCPTYRVEYWRRPMLGVQLVTLTSELREHLGSDETTGVLVSRIFRGSPAEAAGLQVGDLIIAVNSESVGRPEDLSRQIRDHAGQRVEIELLRDRRPLRVDAGISPIGER